MIAVASGCLRPPLPPVASGGAGQPTMCTCARVGSSRTRAPLAVKIIDKAKVEDMGDIEVRAAAQHMSTHA
jgi:hypothetical protein